MLLEKTILIPKSEHTVLCKAGIKGKRGKKKKEVGSHRFQAIKLVFPRRNARFPKKTRETNEENPMEAPLPSYQGAGAAARVLPNLNFALLRPNLWEKPIKGQRFPTGAGQDPTLGSCPKPLNGRGAGAGMRMAALDPLQTLYI